MLSVCDKRYPIQGLRSYRKPHLRQRVAPCRGSSPQERAARLGVLRFQHVVASQHLGSNACWNVFAEPVTKPCSFLWPGDRLFEGKRRIIRFPDGIPSQLGRGIQVFGLYALGSLGQTSNQIFCEPYDCGCGENWKEQDDGAYHTLVPEPSNFGHGQIWIEMGGDNPSTIAIASSSKLRAIEGKSRKVWWPAVISRNPAATTNSDLSSRSSPANPTQ